MQKKKLRGIRIPRRIFGFSLVGGSVMLGGILFLFVLVQFLHVEQHIAYLLQAIVSIETNFFLNRTFNWKDRDGNIALQWFKFHSASAITFPFNQGLFALLSWLGVPYLLTTVLGAGLAAIVNYLANDRFVFHQKKIHQKELLFALPPAEPGDGEESLPHVGIVVPVRNSQRSIRQCLQSLLQQDYRGQFSIYIAGNIREQDKTWDALEDIIDDPRVHIIQIQRPANWAGRDANIKRFFGCEMARKEGAACLALIDSQVIVPPTWLSRAIAILREQQADGVAGRSYRHPDDISLAALYQDSSSFSEWPRYGSGFMLTRENFHKVKGLPVTNNMLLTLRAWECIRQNFQIKTTYGWEDVRLSWDLACAGCTIFCTDAVYIYRNHLPRFRFAKHIAAGASATTFYREQRQCKHAQRMLWKAHFATLTFSLFPGAIFFSLLFGMMALFYALCMGVGSALLVLSFYTAYRVHDIRALCFPALDLLHIALWVIGAATIEWKEDETDVSLANLLLQLR
jgi:putative flippase GtrA/GT2 family glycosyltransferase